MITALDTSVVIAGLLGWHEAHEESRAALESSAEDWVLPAPALAEAYAVLTRLPSPHRLSPTSAHRLLSESFRERVRVVSLTERETWRLLDSLRDRGIAGGATYDALILACAEKAHATRILTLNRRDFERLAPNAVHLVVPGVS